MKRIYWAYVRSDGSWTASFYDLPGCSAVADSIPNLGAAARESLAHHITALLADNQEVPEPTRFAEIPSDSQEGKLMGVEVDIHCVDRGTIRVSVY